MSGLDVLMGEGLSLAEQPATIAQTKRPVPDALLDSLRKLAIDHEPSGWPPVLMSEVTALIQEIDRQREVIGRVNARCDHLGIRLGEIKRERDALKKQAEQAQPTEPIRDDAQASQFLEERLWEFIDMAAKFPHAKPDPRTWAHVMVYAPKAEQAQPVRMDTLAMYRTLCDLTDEASAVDTVIGRLRALYEKLAALRDTFGRMTSDFIAAPPAAQPLTPLTDEQIAALTIMLDHFGCDPRTACLRPLIERGIGQPPEARLGYMDGDVV